MADALRRWRLFFGGVITTALVLALVLALAVVLGGREAERLGLAPVRVGGVSLSLGHVVLSDIALGGGTVAIGRLEVSLSLDGLSRGRVGSIVIERPRIKAAYDGRSVSLGPLDRLLGGGGGDGGGGIVLPFDSLTVEGATVDVADPGGRLGAVVSGKGRAVSRLLPLSYALVLRPEGEDIAFEAWAIDTTGRALLSLSGRSGRWSGRIEASTPPIVFEEDGLQPSHFHPPLAILSGVSGMVAAHGSVSWNGDVVKPDVDLLLEHFTATMGSASLRQASAVVKLTRLWPPETPPDQTLAVAVVEAGLPLSKVEVLFQLDGKGHLTIRDGTMEVAKGRVRLAGASIPLDGGPTDLDLSVEGVDLGEIARIVDLDGLTIDGALDGAIPARIEGGEVLIRGASLRSRAPGVLKYRPEQPPSALHAPEQGISLLLQALADFHYKELRLDLNGRTDGEMAVGVHVSGRNPDLYGGAPVEFNLTVEGPLTQVVRQGLEGYRVPERVRGRMAEFGREHLGKAKARGNAKGMR
ncbi:MAG: YdbH domain-containing protein [Alphaproteobacteria bacterium]|nr:YdbH domain-containing protein [Alphaproteobacteria bacterium]